MSKAKRTESPWKADVMIGLGSRPDIVLWNETIGNFHPIDRPEAIVKVGTPGWPDLMGFQIRRYDEPYTAQPGGFQPVQQIRARFYAQVFGIETKSSSGQQRDNQIQAEKIFRAHYAIYILASAGDWAAIHSQLGAEPDDLCAEEADRMRAELGIGGGIGQDTGPVSGSRRRKGG
jgi:hypothetical protein